MRIGIDAQVVADGNRSGLYWFLRHLVGELRGLTNDDLWLFWNPASREEASGNAELAALFGGAKTRTFRPPRRMYRLWKRISLWNRVDVLMHNLHGRMPLADHAANAFLVPDVIPLAVDYGIPGFADRYRPFYELAARNADVVLVFSEHARLDFIERLGARADNVRVVPLAAGPEFVPSRDPATLRRRLAPFGLGETPYVLLVATIEQRKNHAVLVRAFARLLESEPRLPHRLVLVGGKWIGHEAVFELIERLGLQERVVYLGYAEDLASLYAGADLFVFPSRYEGFGLPPLEAMACGVPVLAANATSLPEVVGNASMLFDPDDAVGLCEKMRQVLTDRALHAELSALCLARAKEFSWRRTAELYLEAFRFALLRKQQRG